MKKRIVVPTDFSNLAKIGACYAVEIAKQIQADLVLLHVLPSLGPTLGTVDSTHLRDEMVEWAEKELKTLMKEIKIDDISITYQIIHGAAVEDVMEDFTRSYAIDVIIMGSKGATGLKRIFVGSNTVGVINKCSKPVIVVPEHIKIAKTVTLVYASDLKNIADEVQLILPYAKALDTSIKIIHVPEQNDLEQLQNEKIISDLMQQTGFQKFEIQFIKGEDVVPTIEKLTDESYGEILIMFTHKVNFLEQLLTKSVTREIAWHCKTPLLVVNNR